MHKPPKRVAYRIQLLRLEYVVCIAITAIKEYLSIKQQKMDIGRYRSTEFRIVLLRLGMSN